MVKALHLPITSIRLIMQDDPRIVLEFWDVSIVFELVMSRDYEKMMSLNDLPVNVNVFRGNGEKKLALIMSNRRKTLGEWIHHLCSISDRDVLYEAVFYFENLQFDIQSLRNIFPKLREICIYFSRDETDQCDVLYAQTILKAFLPDVQSVKLNRVPLQENLSIQHIGMANLEEFKFLSRSTMNVDCLFTWNFESCIVNTVQMSLRDWNRFFKLWIKGSNPRLKELYISGDMETIPDWNILLKGLRAKEAEEEGSMKYIIKNCNGISGQIKIIYHLEESAIIDFIVLN
ncbi:hypothetical protein L5515_005147 [Caenorhabditis briggsae]|uniref:Sdz-33 F-box domain-containing protein n=1 Tax=Caenorhabditis briggsae TaxID=6238 RepID=A0AAE9JEI8_CAEBR|nr:hypothetical protein L5515_005147 [Caenorhabditis briggsae]